MTPEIDLSFDLPYPSEKVWRSLTTPELLAAWLGPNDMSPAPGARFTLRPQGGPPVTCEVVEIDARRRRLRLAWTYDAEAEATTVRFELVETPTGTILRIAHSGFGAAAVAAQAPPQPPQPPRLRLPRRAPTARAHPNRTRLQWAA